MMAVSRAVSHVGGYYSDARQLDPIAELSKFETALHRRLL